MTSKTTAIGVDVASDKSLTNRLLDSAGLPVPRSEVVDTEEGAVAAAKRLGFPCVVKPLDGNHGRGVHLDLRTEEAVRAAFHGALAQSRGGDVVVETYVAGNDYRCLVIGGKVAAIAERVPASRDRRRRAHRPRARRRRQRRPAPRHRPREGADADQGRRRRPRSWSATRASSSTTSRPTGTWVKLALTGNMSTGGTSIDRTHRGPPRQRRDRRDRGPDRRARRRRHRLHLPRHRRRRSARPAARSSRSTRRPGFRMHTHPTEGEPQYVARPVIDSLFPPGVVGADPDHRA